MVDVFNGTKNEMEIFEDVISTSSYFTRNITLLLYQAISPTYSIFHMLIQQIIPLIPPLRYKLINKKFQTNLLILKTFPIDNELTLLNLIQINGSQLQNEILFIYFHQLFYVFQ